MFTMHKSVQTMTVWNRNASPVVWTFLRYDIKYDTSKEVRNAPVPLVTAVLINCYSLRIFSTFPWKYHDELQQRTSYGQTTWSNFLQWYYSLLHTHTRTGKKTECQEVRLMFHNIFLHDRQLVVAPNVTIPNTQTFRFLFKPRTDFYITAKFTSLIFSLINWDHSL